MACVAGRRYIPFRPDKSWFVRSCPRRHTLQNDGPSRQSLTPLSQTAKIKPRVGGLVEAMSQCATWAGVSESPRARSSSFRPPNTTLSSHRPQAKDCPIGHARASTGRLKCLCERGCAMQNIAYSESTVVNNPILRHPFRDVSICTTARRLSSSRLLLPTGSCVPLR